MCWFKASAAEHIARAREMACILEENGVYVRMIKTRHPGYIVYQDKHQVAAGLFANLRL